MRKVNAVGLENVVVLISIWFPICVYDYANKGDLSTIGIVKAKDTLTDTIKYYIGVGKGENQQFDEDLIVAGGAPFYPESIKEFLE